MGYLYLLHFEPRYKHAGHYLGYAPKLKARIAEHQAGKGARLTQVAVAAGCQLLVARTWRGKTRRDERAMKGGRADGGKHHRGSLARLCPICHPPKVKQVVIGRKAA